MSVLHLAAAWVPPLETPQFVPSALAEAAAVQAPASEAQALPAVLHLQAAALAQAEEAAEAAQVSVEVVDVIKNSDITQKNI